MAKNYSELLKDPRWQRKRLKILERDDFTCQDCWSDTDTLHVHHIRYAKGKPWETPDEWLLTLCEKCHACEEAMKDFDFYSVLSKAGITRRDMLRLLNVVANRLKDEHMDHNTPSQTLDHVLSDIMVYKIPV